VLMDPTKLILRSASLLGYGTMLAQWVGVGFFHVDGQAGWRVPFAINCVPALFLVVLIWRVPESPRWRKSSPNLLQWATN
jgi:MFS family permease